MNPNFVLNINALTDDTGVISSSSLPSVQLPGFPTSYSSYLTSASFNSGRQGLMRGINSEPEIRLNQIRNHYSTSAAFIENQDLTRVLDQKPEVLLPQDVVAQKHSINVVDANAVPIQIWEGCVQSVNMKAGTMKASLNAKMGAVPDHVGEIDLQWVSQQDVDLVKPGAVFYLTLFKRVKRGGSIENSQSIQFRRRPNWSKYQIDRINERAEVFLSKIKNKPFAE